ncbi:MAG TPA: adenylate/guanylate cyclase domain-containing protein [Reyranella sp.]|nr:adenylate/guanylate cyclase domain-containing protein [Reyranella sp.]
MEAPPLERKLVAILAADVEGYSRMMEIDEEGTLAILSAHRIITDELIAQHGGRIFNTAGDSVLAEFASVFSAVECAIEIQRALARANEPIEEARQLRFRIGINVGDVMVKDGDIFGDGVNIAARLEGLAKPGGICISRGVRDHIRHKVAHKFEDLGEQAVKNIAQPVRCFRLLPRKGKPEPPPAPIALQPEPAKIAAPPPAPAPDPKSIELVFWDSIKDSVRAADYDAYLAQYPEGDFAALARARLAELLESTAAARDPAEREIELAFWDSVRALDNVESMQAYLDKYPSGEFVALAEIRLKELSEAAGEPAADCVTERRPAVH